MGEPPAHKMIHDVMDVIESGMEDPAEGQGRAFWIGLTLTTTSTSLMTDTVTPTTTQAVPRRKNKNKNKKNKNKKNKNKKKPDSRSEFMDLVSDIYQGAVVTDQYGEEADIS